ncbi:DUF3034 family protein [Caulobacter sp. KR2-114]|uniref:DUF3034 family protein n=1 Tax=Caulobacter sp. KR2-114 TaxID=3400912 RepID=UPI003C127D52
MSSAFRHGVVALVAAIALCPAAARAGEAAYMGKLLLTGGVSAVEGEGGGGLAAWSTITGYETRDGVGANAHATYVGLKDFSLRSAGVAVGLHDRLELSYARQAFDTGAAGGRLGLGDGFTFHQDVVGAKLRLLGDAVYDQDRLLPQVSVGVEYKHNDRGAIIRAVGGRHDSGVDYYVAATKLLLGESLLLDATLRATKANQMGLLGFGGDRNDAYSLQAEGSAALLLNRHLALGAEYRTKPDNLGFAHESDWADVFVAYALNKHLSITAAYVDLGDIATFRRQRGGYVSLQAGF